MLVKQLVFQDHRETDKSPECISSALLSHYNYRILLCSYWRLCAPAGLETYMQQRIVSDKATASHFISEMLTRNLQHTGCGFVSCF